MTDGRIAVLERRGVVAVGGPEAEKFLNDLVTADIGRAGPGQAVFAGLLTPQGKILFDFIVFSDGDRFLFDLPRAMAADFVKRLGFYKLRAKVTVEDVPPTPRCSPSGGRRACITSTASRRPIRAWRRSAGG